MTRMTSLTYILLAHFVTNIAFALSHNSDLHIKTERDGRLTTRFGFLNFHMVHSSIAHSQTNDHVPQFGH